MNFTNEGGVDGTVRFLKNITGMWLLEQCRAVWSRQGREYSYEEIVRMTISEDSIFVEKQTGLKAIQIKTSPYPGFATDL